MQAERYWPNLNEEVKFGSVNITVNVKNKQQENTGNDLVKSVMVINGPEGEKVIEHIHVRIKLCSGLDGRTCRSRMSKTSNCSGIS